MTETVTARLTLPYDTAALAIRQHVSHWDVECQEVAGGLEAQLWGGSFRLVGGREARITLQAPDMGILFMLQEGVAYALDPVGGQARWDHVEEGALAPNVTLMRVERVTQVSPRFRRVRLRGDVSRYTANGLHFRVLIPPEGVTPEWPRVDDKGRARWPEGPAALHRPAFTTRAVNADEGWLEFDLFTHDGARTTEWSRDAEGREVGMVGPGGGWLLDHAWVGLFGDETAMPAIARILAALPDHAQGVAMLRLDAADVPPLPHPAGVRVIRAETSADLLAGLSACVPPAQNRYLWFAGEKGDAARARKIMQQKGMAKTEMMAAGYWSLTGE